MNHDCNGDYLPTLGLWRCLRDGDVALVDAMPTVCPLCGREARGARHNAPRHRQVTLIEVEIPPWGFVVVDRYEHAPTTDPRAPLARP